MKANDLACCKPFGILELLKLGLLAARFLGHFFNSMEGFVLEMLGNLFVTH